MNDGQGSISLTYTTDISNQLIEAEWRIYA